MSNTHTHTNTWTHAPIPPPSQGKSAIQSYKASQQKQNPATWGPPPPPNATQEIFGALKSALGTVVGAAVQSGKAVASQGTDVLQDVVAHRYGPEVASVSNEGVRAIVTVVQTVAAVKTFGAANMARHTVEETAKGLVQDEMQWGKVWGMGGVGGWGGWRELRWKVLVYKRA